MRWNYEDIYDIILNSIVFVEITNFKKILQEFWESFMEILENFSENYDKFLEI